MTLRFATYLRFLSLLALLSVMGIGTARADLIVNGSFENPSVNGGYQVFANGSVPGWTSNNNEIEIDTSSAVGLPSAYSGTQSVELNGNTFDTISQTVTGLIVGQKYQLTWAYAGRSGSGNQQMNVLFGGSQVGQNNDTGNGPFAWSNNSVIVTATSASMVLSFAAINVGGNANAGNELDAVTLNAVPEPAALLLLGTMITGYTVWRRRQA